MSIADILNKLSNPFNKLTGEEKAELKDYQEEVKRDVRAFSRLAKELYDDKRYQGLKNLFKKVYEQNIRLLIYFDCDDTDKYLLKMREFQIQLRTLKSIFDTPEGFIEKEEALEKKKE